MMSGFEEQPKKSCLFSCLSFIGGTIGLLIFAIVFFFGLFLALRAAGAYLIVASNLESANAIVVLSGGDESRMQEALRLYNEGYSKLIILTETGNYAEGYSHLHSFDMRIQLLNNGVPSGNILITDRVVDNTQEEVQAVKTLLTNRHLESCIVVTDPYHTRRAFKIFSDVFTDSGIKVSIQPVRGHWYNSRTWFLKLDGWRFTVLEYLKLMAYQLD